MTPPGQPSRTTWPPCRPTACTGSSPAPPTKAWSQTKDTPPPPRKRSSTSSRRSGAQHRCAADLNADVTVLAAVESEARRLEDSLGFGNCELTGNGALGHEVRLAAACSGGQARGTRNDGPSDG